MISSGAAHLMGGVNRTALAETRRLSPVRIAVLALAGDASPRRHVFEECVPVCDPNGVDCRVPEVGVLDEDRKGHEAAIGPTQRGSFCRLASRLHMPSGLASILDGIPPECPVIQALEKEAIPSWATYVGQKDIYTSVDQQLDDW